jgi:pyrophosphatase PpaX
MRFPVVLFDLDGTIVDSGWMILASYRHATETVLGREFPDDVLMAKVGSGHLEEQMREFDEAKATELAQAYRDFYRPLHSELEAFPGMLELLERLDREGRQLGIVSAKRHDIVQLAFEALGFGTLMDVVVGSDEAPRGKPHPDQILVALDRLDVDPDQTAYVGDAPFDIAAAKAAGVHAIGVTWGGIHTRERMEAEGPDAVVDTADELYAVL